MGSSPSENSQPEVELRISHPSLANARVAVVNQMAYIKIVVPMQEKEYQAWADGLHQYVKSTSKIMLPTRHMFNKAGLCGQLGSAEVPTLSFRSSTPTFPTYSAMKSTTGRARNTSSLNRNCGTCSLVSLRPSDRMRRDMWFWGISGPRISFSMRRDLYGWRIGIAGRVRGLNWRSRFRIRRPTLRLRR